MIRALKCGEGVMLSISSQLGGVVSAGNSRSRSRRNNAKTLRPFSVLAAFSAWKRHLARPVTKVLQMFICIPRQSKPSN